MPQPGQELATIPLADIAPGPADEHRADVDPEELRALANSILREGLIQPIVVARRDGAYVTVAGRRRREACRLAGLDSVQCIIVDADQAHGYRASLAENLFRTDLSPIEEANTCIRAIEERGMTPDEVAATMGRSPGWVRDRLTMLDWPEELIGAVHARALSVAAATPLSTIANEDTRNALIEEAIRHGATARITSAWAQAARMTNTNPLENQAEPGSDAPPAAPMIPMQDCWACGQRHPCTALQHLPTCAPCYETIPPAIRQSMTTPQTPNDATALSSSAASTPM